MVLRVGTARGAASSACLSRGISSRHPFVQATRRPLVPGRAASTEEAPVKTFQHGRSCTVVADLFVVRKLLRCVDGVCWVQSVPAALTDLSTRAIRGVGHR